MSESKEQQWSVVPMKIHGWAIHDAEGNVVVHDIYDEEIARFIVRAANSHEALLECVRFVVTNHQSWTALDWRNWIANHAKPALALAEKES